MYFLKIVLCCVLYVLKFLVDNLYPIFQNLIKLGCLMSFLHYIVFETTFTNRLFKQITC